MDTVLAWCRRGVGTVWTRCWHGADTVLTDMAWTRCWHGADVVADRALGWPGWEWGEAVGGQRLFPHLRQHHGARQELVPSLQLGDPLIPQGPSMDASKKVDLKIIIIGALGVGKTSLLHQYVHKTFYEDYRTTLGASILTKVLAVDNTPLKLQIWDTGGQERFRSMVSTFYKGSDGCMLAFDVTDRESFESLDNWRDDFLEKVIPREHDFPMVVLGNKIDLCDRQVPKEIASAWCKEKDIPYFEVSAKNNINVAEAFETLAKQALTTYKGIFESYLTDSIKLTPNDKPKKSCC
uniref:Ras-related protein Rab-7b n=1 Tax=Falco tinnunculus TaxID=100819 RepID=A0A8C4TT75_FALTI